MLTILVTDERTDREKTLCLLLV